MTFKDVIKSDIKSIFLNFEEFGSRHKLNGKERLVIVDENELTDREKKIKYHGMGEELYQKQLLFYIAAEDFGSMPSPGKILNFDGKDYLITDAGNEDGIYSISLEAVTS